MKNILSAFLAVFCFASCSFYSIESREDSPVITQPKKSFFDVEYEPEIKRKYVVIGDLRVRTERNRNMNDVIRKMKMEAALMGADAVTGIRIDDQPQEKEKSRLRIDYIGQAVVYQ